MGEYNARWDERGKPINRRIQYEKRTRCEKREKGEEVRGQER